MSTSSLADSGDREVVYKKVPLYPVILKDHNIGGLVKIQFTVTREGAVKEPKLIGGNPILGDAAIDAVRQWKYAPAGAESVLTIEIRFTP